MKILFVVSYTGIGLTIYYTRMALALKKKGCEIVLVSDLGEEDLGLSDELKKEGIEHYAITGLDNYSNIHSIRELFKLINNRDFDIIHTSGLIKLNKIRLARFLSGKKIPIVVQIESIEDETVARKVIYLTSFPYLNTCTVIPVSTWTKEILSKYRVKEDKMIKIYNAIDLEHFDQMASMELSYDFLDKVKGKTIIAQVSRLHPLKGQNYFLMAAKEILLHTSDVHFLVVGDGVMKENLKKMVNDFRITDHVTFTGNIPNRFIPFILTRIDICVLASLKEQFPHIILEYMAAKKPIVATNVGGVKEAVLDGVNGYIVHHLIISR